MPNIVATPAQLSWTGGTLGTIPQRIGVSPAQLKWTGQFVLVGPGTGTSFAVPNIGYLGRLRRDVAITERGGPEKMGMPGGGRPTMQEQIRQKQYAEATEKVVSSLADQVNDNATLLNEIREAQKQAQMAADTANAVQREQNLANSRPDPITVLTSASDGSITITAHNRIYGDGATVSVNSGALSGYSSGAFIRVYYMDAAREGGAVEYQGTTDDVVQSGDTHVVGGVTIPEQGEPPGTGSGPQPPGYIFDPGDILA